MYYAFISNGLNVLFLSGIVIWTNLSLNKRYSRYLLGIMFGLITIFVMNGRISVVQGRFYDFRHITMTMAGFIGGPVTAAIAAIMSSIYRYFMGGTGSMGGITSIIVFACFGTLLGKRIKSDQNGKKPLFWLFIGILMALIFLFIIGFIPPWKGDSLKVLRVVSAPYLIITPLATTIIFNFYFWSYEFFSKATILNTILNSSTLNLMIKNAHGPIVLSKSLQILHQSSQKFEEFLKLTNEDLDSLKTTKQIHKEITTDDERHFAADFSGFQMPSGENAHIAILNDITDLKKEQEKLRGATDRFRKAFQLGPHMMTIMRKSDYQYLYVNDRFLEERGFSRDEIIGKTPIDIGVTEHEFKRIIDTIGANGSVNNIECSFVTKFGLTGTAILSVETIQIDDQECFLFAYNDVTGMKRMQTERVEQLTKNLALEAELSRSNQLIADIIKYMPDGFYVLDNQWCFTFVNRKTEDFFYKTREELLGKELWEIDPQAQGTLIEQNFRKSRTTNKPITFEYLSSLQQNKWHQITIYPSKSGLTVYFKDINEQKLAHEKLIKSQTEMVMILESMTDCFCAYDRDLRYTYVNRAGELILGKSRDELLGRKITDLYRVNDNTLPNFQEVIREKRSISFEILSVALGNKWLDISAYPTENGLTCYFRDITSRKMAEETLRQSEEKFSKAFHGAPIMMTLATVDEGKFIDINEALCSSISYTREEIIGRTSNDINFFVDMERRKELGRILMVQGKIENAEVEFRTKSGEIRNGLCWSQLFYIEGKPCHITGLIDVTEQKRIQREMARLDRLNLVGQMAAGIGHEIRNPMTTVRGYLQLLGTKPDFATHKSTFDIMISEIDRANSIITEFLSLSQMKQTELKLQNLNDILHNLFPLLEADAFSQNKQIRLIPGKIPDLKINIKEITQLILNLSRNGFEAMKEKGCLTVESYLQGDNVVLAIEDEGSGIPPENINKLGIPFFTTKDYGTGLGLATCYKIVESHNARICVDSNPSGTTFYITIPVPNDKKNNMIA